MLNGGDVELSKAEMQMLIWIAGRTENMVENVVSVIRKAMTADVKRQEMSPVRRAGKSPRQGAKAAFDGRNGCQKCFCVTFGESNKAYVPVGTKYDR